MFFMYGSRGGLRISKFDGIQVRVKDSEPGCPTAIVGYFECYSEYTDILETFVSEKAANDMMQYIFTAIEEGCRIFDFTDRKFDNMRYREPAEIKGECD